MNYASSRERDWHGRFVKPASPSVFNKKEYYHNRYLANKEKHIAMTKEWAKNNPEKRAEIRKRWKLKNKDKVNYYAKLRIYREKNAEGFHTLSDLKEIRELWNNKCAYCRQAPAETIDHVVALTKGGTNDPSNLVPACFSCNSSKGNKPVWMWNFWWYYKYSRINEYGS